MSTSPGETASFAALAQKPNRARIILTLGGKSGASFKELKAEMGIGVGTLYYHLDSLAPYVTQNGSRQYVLTDLGKQAYDYLKNVEAPIAQPSRETHLGAALGEALFFESYLERIGTEPLSNLGPLVGIILLLAVFSASFKFEPTMLILRISPVAPPVAVVGTLISWAVVFLAVLVMAVFVFRSGVSIIGVASIVSFSYVPLLVLMVLTGFKRIFNLAYLDPLYGPQFYPVFAIIFAVWAAYILVISLRSAARLSIERALLVALTVLLINVGYLWLAPTIKI